MKPRNIARIIAGPIAAATLFFAGAAQAQGLADGNDWMKSSEVERRAYLVGVSNVISVGVSFERAKLRGEQETFLAQAKTGLGLTSIEEAARIVDDWYKRNPSQLDKPILSVLWREVAKPRLAKSM